MIPYNITNSGISLLMEGKPYNIAQDHVFYDEIREAIFNNDTKSLKEFVHVTNAVKLHSKGLITIYDDFVQYKGEKINLYLAERVIDHYKNDFPIDSLINFTEKLMSNQTIDVKDDLFKWMENASLPICENGNFIAYKIVKSDFTPYHKGPYGQDQSVGQTVKMPREQCDPDRNNTCSSGLHFCSYSFLPSFGDINGDSVVLILEINPADVVAIPTDYNLSKGRTCKFKVIGTIPNEILHESDVLKNTYVYDTDDDDEDYIVNDDDFLCRYHNITKKKYNMNDMDELYANVKSYAKVAKHYGDISAETVSKWLKEFRG